MRQHYHALGVGDIFVRQEDAAKRGLDAEQGEESIGHISHANAFSGFPAGKIDVSAAEGR